MKKCSTCLIEKSLDEFHKDKSKKDGRQCHCKSCNNDKVSKTRQKIKKQCLDYKGGKCSVCGYDRCDSALEFHHKDPTKKDFVINTSRGLSFKNFVKELDKCVLLCANCHREVHSGLIRIKD